MLVAVLVLSQAAAFSRRAPPTMGLLSKIRDLARGAVDFSVV